MERSKELRELKEAFVKSTNADLLKNMKKEDSAWKSLLLSALKVGQQPTISSYGHLDTSVVVKINFMNNHQIFPIEFYFVHIRSYN